MIKPVMPPLNQKSVGTWRKLLTSRVWKRFLFVLYIILHSWGVGRTFPGSGDVASQQRSHGAHRDGQGEQGS